MLERAVSRLSKLLPPDQVASGSEGISSTDYSSRIAVSTPTGNNADVGKSKPAIRSSYGSGSTDEDVAMMLEDFAMGNRVNRSRDTHELERDPSDSYSYSTILYGSQDIYEKSLNSMPTLVSTMDGFTPHLGLPDRHPLSLLVDPTVNVIGRLVSVLPNQSQCATLVHFYVSHSLSSSRMMTNKHLV